MNTPRDGKVVYDLTSTGTETMPGLVRIWQPGGRTPRRQAGAEEDAPKAPPLRKGELGRTRR